MCKPPRCRWDTCDRRSCWYQEPWDPMAVSSKPLPVMGFRSWDPPCLLWPSFIFLNPLHTQPQFINWGLQEQAKQHPGLAALPWAWRSHPRTCRAKHRANGSWEMWWARPPRGQQSLTGPGGYTAANKGLVGSFTKEDTRGQYTLLWRMELRLILVN